MDNNNLGDFGKLDKDAFGHLMGFLNPKEKGELRLTSKDVKKAVDKRPNLSEKENDLKLIYEKYLEKQGDYEKTKDELKDQYQKLSSMITVKIYNSIHRFSKTIAKLMLSIFPKLKSSINRIEHLEYDLNLSNENSLLKDKFDIANDLKKQHKTHLEKYKLANEKENSYQIIRTAFIQAGIDYDTLPELNLHGQVGKTGYIDFIKPRHMQHPVMKGVDTFGRRFIAIKATSRITEREVVEVLFERDAQDSTWCQIGFGVIRDPKGNYYLIPIKRGKCFDKFDEQLRDFLKNKGNKYYEI